MEDNALQNDDKLLLKACFVGSKDVGKTSFFITFLEGYFPEHCNRAVFDSHQYEATSGEHEVFVQLHDVRSETRLEYSRILPPMYDEANAVVIFYSVADRESFLDVERVWLIDAQTHCPDAPIVLVASKTDLREESGDVITTAEGEELAKRVRAGSFVEISAKNNDGLDFMMDEVLRCAVDHHILESRKVRKQGRHCHIL